MTDDDMTRNNRTYYDMTSRADRPHVDTQSITDPDAHVYEAVATLEYTGRRPTRPAIATATGMSDRALGETLAWLCDRGLLVTTEADGETGYEPARRDWSTRPDQATGHPWS